MAYARWRYKSSGSRHGCQSTINVSHDQQPRSACLDCEQDNMSRFLLTALETSYESFVLANGENKVEMEVDTRMSSAS